MNKTKFFHQNIEQKPKFMATNNEDIYQGVFHNE